MDTDIVICAEQRLFAEALATVLSKRGYHVVAITDEPDEAAAVAARSHVDICLMERELRRADTAAGIRRVTEASPDTSVIVLSVSTDLAVARGARELGALAVADKEDSVEEVIDLIERVRDGEAVTPPPVPGGEDVEAPAEPGRDVLGLLTAREREVLERLVQGQSTASLAKDMGITYATARTHIQNLLAKLGVHSKLEAVALTISNRWLTRPVSPSDGDQSAVTSG
jgi:two-component system nitrate/nitrite response regulator NarL